MFALRNELSLNLQEIEFLMDVFNVQFVYIRFEERIGEEMAVSYKSGNY